MNAHRQGSLAAALAAVLRVCAVVPGHGSCGLLLLGCLLLATGCDRSRPVETTPANLAAVQQDFDGTHVVTSGVLRSFPEPLHYWIEDADLQRVAIVGAPASPDFVGRSVRVEGYFRYDRTEGRRIEATHLEPISPES